METQTWIKPEETSLPGNFTTNFKLTKIQILFWKKGEGPENSQAGPKTPAFSEDPPSRILPKTPRSIPLSPGSRHLRLRADNFPSKQSLPNPTRPMKDPTTLAQSVIVLSELRPPRVPDAAQTEPRNYVRIFCSYFLPLFFTLYYYYLLYFNFHGIIYSF